MAVFSDGSFSDYFDSNQGSLDSPGVFSYSQQNLEQQQRNPNYIKNLGVMSKLQSDQLSQQKQAMELQKAQEDRQIEMAMKQAISEASKYGPDAIASVYEQFGDAKTAMDIRASAQGLVKGGLETKKLMLDVESAKRAAVMNQVAARISSLPANQRAQEWANLIPQVNAQMGTEIPEEYSSGNLMGIMAVQQGAQDSLRTMLSNPQTAPLAEPALRAMADPAVDKYFNDLIASKKASLGPDLVTRGNGQDTSVDRSISQLDSEYQRLKEPTQLSPKMQAAQDQAQGELRQEAQAQAQELSNEMAALAAKEKPTAADVARVKALAESVRASQTPLGVPSDSPAVGRSAQESIQQTKTFTTKTDAKGNVTFSESVKESPSKADSEAAIAQEMAVLQESLSGLDLPPSTWEDPEKNKPLSTVGKLQYDAARAKSPEERAQLLAAASQQAKNAGGVNVTVNPDNDQLVLQKKALDEAQTKYTYAQRQIQELSKMTEVPKGYNPLTYKGAWQAEIARISEKAQVASPEQMKNLVESSSFIRKIDRYTQRVIKGLSGAAASDQERKAIQDAYINKRMSTSEYITATVDLINDAIDSQEFEYELQTGKPPKEKIPRLTYEQFLGPEFAEDPYKGKSFDELEVKFFELGGTPEEFERITGRKPKG